MSLADLRRALEEGDVDGTRGALTHLDGTDSLHAFMAAYEARAQADAAFEVFRWIGELPPPEDPLDRENWLRALNNACNLAIQHEGDDDARLRLARRAIGFGAMNIAIFHNAACVLCAVGALDEAVDAVAAAIDHGYGSAPMVDDPDLDAIRHTADFADAVGAARDADEAALNRQLAALRAELFMGDEVPEELARLWRRQLSIASARGVDDGGIRRLLEQPEYPDIGGAEEGTAALIESSVWVAELHPDRFVGYFCEENAAAGAPVVSLDGAHELWVTADLYDHLRLAAEGDRAREQALRDLLVLLRLDDTDLSADRARERAEAAKARVDAFLAARRTT